MKIVIVSDTHQNTSLIEKVLLIEKADLYLHAGDSGVSQTEIYPFISAKGNCDYYPFNTYVSEYTPIGKIVVKHHPFSLSEIDGFIKQGYKIFVFGHTHKKLVEQIGQYYLFNPGSLFLPRDSDKGSYLVLNIDENKLDYEFKFID